MNALIVSCSRSICSSDSVASSTAVVSRARSRAAVSSIVGSAVFIRRLPRRGMKDWVVSLEIERLQLRDPLLELKDERLEFRAPTRCQFKLHQSSDSLKIG